MATLGGVSKTSVNTVMIYSLYCTISHTAYLILPHLLHFSCFHRLLLSNSDQYAYQSYFSNVLLPSINLPKQPHFLL